MTSQDDRRTLLDEIARAHAAGARLNLACAEAGIDPRTRQRWLGGTAAAAGEVRPDRRPQAERPRPAQALSAEERARIAAVANEARFADAPPARIVPALADEGVYIASESSFHRVLRDHGQMNRRGRACLPRASRPPSRKASFPVRSGRLLSAPDLEMSRPRSAAKGMRLGCEADQSQSPAAKRSAASTASTGPPPWRAPCQARQWSRENAIHSTARQPGT